MCSKLEKDSSRFQGIKLLLCENPLPPLEEAQRAAESELPRSNFYTEPYSGPLRRLLAERIGVPERLIHLNAGSELILRQIFDRLGQRVHLLTPTYPLFPEIAEQYTETRLLPECDFRFDLRKLKIPEETTLTVIINPNNPNGGTFDMRPLPALLAQHLFSRRRSLYRHGGRISGASCPRIFQPSGNPDLFKDRKPCRPAHRLCHLAQRTGR